MKQKLFIYSVLVVALNVFGQNSIFAQLNLLVGSSNITSLNYPKNLSKGWTGFHFFESEGVPYRFQYHENGEMKLFSLNSDGTENK